ncbi:MAG TPA: dihydropteroate synthase [Luteibaculaceae bacterium]|nr:dihydropteroate synthase [Luteibaculaceae bacterium]
MNPRSSENYQTINAGGRLIDFKIPRIMAIVNLTSDSFYGQSRVQDDRPLLYHVEKSLTEGADFIDLGAQSTRPGAPLLSASDELTQLLPALEKIKKHFPQAVLSVDTFYAEVATQAVDAGAHLINDISGGKFDPDMFSVVVRQKVPYIMGHVFGSIHDIHRPYQGQELLIDINIQLIQQLKTLFALGAKDVWIDPCFGFGKTREQNFELLANLSHLKQLDCLILAGISRKSMIYKTLDISAEEALNGTTALHMIALEQGASVLRVHDVWAAAECIKLFREISQATKRN